MTISITPLLELMTSFYTFKYFNGRISRIQANNVLTGIMETFNLLDHI